MITSALLIGAIIIAVTQAVKFLSPKVTGMVTMIVAVLVGIVIALFDTQIGLDNITVAQGIWLALGSVGVHTVASAVNTKTV